MKKYDLIVVGGGITGVSAAVSAKRLGLSVLIAEESGNFGGAMSNCFVYPYMPFWTKIDGQTKYLSAGIFTELRKRHDAYCQCKGDMRFHPEYMKRVFDDIITESGVDVLFHAKMFECKTEGRMIKSVRFAVKSGVIELEAKFFIDATGDGDLFTFAGCDFQLGRETDNLCQPMTTCFRIANIDESLMAGDEFKQVQALYKKYRSEGKIKNPREDILRFNGLGEGIIHFNTTRVVKCNPTDPFEIGKAEIEARRQICEMVDFLRENCEAFKNCVLVSVAPSIGVRESRMLRGEHVLTAEELKVCTMFDDSIALGNYDIDIHNPEGSGTSHYYFPEGKYYSIPYRSLLPKEYDNLLVGGRCISATHEAQASIRIIPICATTGEAAGTAIGIINNSGANTHTADIAAIRNKLTENGAAI